MIAIDTNVLLRLVLDDDVEQNIIARREIEAAVAAGDDILINDVVLAEALWTLRRTYGISKGDLVVTLRTMMGMESFCFESGANLAEALRLFEGFGADFADCLIVAKNNAAGCRATLSFDSQFRGLPRTKVL